MKIRPIVIASALICGGIGIAPGAFAQQSQAAAAVPGVSSKPAAAAGSQAKVAGQGGQATKIPLPPLPEIPKPDNLEMAKEEIMPLSPEEILKLKEALDKSRRAANTYVGTPPKPSSGSISVDLSPGSPPPVVRLAPGHVTTLSFVDVTGAPWPISSITNGDKKSFDIQTPEKDSNTATIAAMGWYSVGNAAIMLAGLPSPVTVTLVGGQKEVDYRVDMRIPRRGPNAAVQQVQRAGMPEHNAEFMNILDGVVPKGAAPLRVEGEGQAWMMNGSIVFRTTRVLISPAWTSKYQSSDGTFVYELPYTPVLLTSVNGGITEVRISQ